MSTKIYNGFRMGNLSANEMIEFINELREKIRPEINDAFCDGIVKICRKIISKCIQYNIDFDSSEESAKKIEEKFLRSWYLASLTTTTTAQRALYDIDKVIEDLDFPFVGGILNMAVNIYKNDTINESFVSCYNDIRSNIAFLKGDEEHILFIVYGNIFIDLLFELIIKNDEIVRKYGIEEYGYWNNTDKPDNISEEAWIKRSDDWNNALTDIGVASQHGLCTTDIINNENLFSLFRMAQDGRSEKIIAMMPSVKEMIAQLVHDKTINYFVRINPEYNSNDSNSYSLCLEYKKMFESGNSEMIAYADELNKEMWRYIPDCSIAEILSESLLELLPKYMEWRKENIMNNKGGSLK